MLFEVHSYKKCFDANKVTLISSGGHPYIVRQSINNGQKGFIDENEEYLNDGNTISFGQDTATMFYQEKPYFTGDKIKILKSKFDRFNKINAQFFLAAMRKSFMNFSWGDSSYSVDVIKNQQITLPVTQSGEIDFDFIEKIVLGIENERTTEMKTSHNVTLSAYLEACCLDNYVLTEKEIKAIQDFESIKLKKYTIGDLFKVSSSKKKFDAYRVKLTQVWGYPYVVRTAFNNGQKGLIDEDVDYLNDGNTISFGQDTATMFYQEKPYFTGDKIKVLKCKTSSLNKLTALFLITNMRNAFSMFSWGASSFNIKTIECQAISLPFKDDKPDFSAMETLIRAVQKLVITDFVENSESNITNILQIVNNDIS